MIPMNRKRKKLKNKYVYLVVLLIVVITAILSYVIKSDNKLNCSYSDGDIIKS